MPKLSVLALSLALASAACGHAQVWEQDARGGTLSLHGEQDAAMKEAHALMAAHCGAGRYEIVRRYHVVVGQEAYAATSTDRNSRTDTERDRVTTGSRHEDYGHAHGHSATSEDETRYRSSNTESSTVSGVRDVNEMRVQYDCVR